MDKSYLTYPKRGYGQDHDLYDWRMAKDRPKLEWRGGKVAVCFIIPLEFFPLNPSEKPFKHPGAMVTPYPDLRHFTVRDYGNRVGVFRILEELKTAGVKATFAVNAEIAKRYPPLVETIKSAGHEIAAHGLSTDNIHHEELSENEETSLINDARSEFGKPRGWLSPARNQTSRTPALLAKAGFAYHLDWEMDQVPVKMTTPNGGITAIPNSYELSDFTLLHARKQTEHSWLKQIIDSIDVLVSEHEQYGGQMLGLTLTPYVIGQPFRIWALRELLSHLSQRDDVTMTTAIDIHSQFQDQTT